MKNKKINIAIDGYSSCGKSTLAKSIAKRYGLRYVDTGAMYRAVALYMLRNGWNPETAPEEEFLRKKLGEVKIDFGYDAEKDRIITLLNGEDVEDEIRSMTISNVVSKISQHPLVRKQLVKWQQEMIGEGGVVMDGRDIGTVVMPDADLKIFLTAKPEVRAQRRFRELKSKGMDVKMDDVIRNLNERDFMDVNRAENPLKKADDAIEIDNSEMTLEEQNRLVFEMIDRILDGKSSG
ncbi:MAG: cytidylate kinase [Vicingaceae bacterium]|nr:MAG: cytidylate kinase [Vicingaceae bacterium]